VRELVGGVVFAALLSFEKGWLETNDRVIGGFETARIARD